jgi:hypothetical protein
LEDSIRQALEHIGNFGAPQAAILRICAKPQSRKAAKPWRERMAFGKYIGRERERASEK